MISCIILTKDEEQDIERCLRSLSWIDDVHVVDSGSSDKTCDIARLEGASVTVRDRGGDFVHVEQKNWALDNLELRHSWVLFMDADELSTEAFAEAVLTSVKNAHGTQAFWCAPKFMYHGTWLKRTKAYPNWHPRLLHTGHVRLVGGLWESFPPDVTTGWVSVPYIHHQNSKGLPAWIEKHVRYALWEARAQRGEVPSVEEARRVPVRRIATSLGPLRPLAAVLGTLVLRRSLLDGRGAWSYTRRVLIYELLVREALAEARAVNDGRPL